MLRSQSNERREERKNDTNMSSGLPDDYPGNELKADCSLWSRPDKYESKSQQLQGVADTDFINNLFSNINIVSFIVFPLTATHVVSKKAFFEDIVIRDAYKGCSVSAQVPKNKEIGGTGQFLLLTTRVIFFREFLSFSWTPNCLIWKM